MKLAQHQQISIFHVQQQYGLSHPQGALQTLEQTRPTHKVRHLGDDKHQGFQSSVQGTRQLPRGELGATGTITALASALKLGSSWALDIVLEASPISLSGL
jgi:hypothetical protein